MTPLTSGVTRIMSTVETLVPALVPACDDYLRGSEGGVFYHSQKYRAFLQDLLHCADATLVAKRGSRVTGVMPLMYKEWEGMNPYNSLPYFGSWGGAVADDDATHEALVAAYNELATADGTLAATVISNPLSPFARLDADRLIHNLHDRRIAQITSLAGTGTGGDGREAVLASVSGSARRNVRKAEREGISVDIDPLALPRLREMHEENMGALGGMAKTARFFDLVPRHFEPRHDYDLFVARHEGQIIGALLMFYFGGVAEYFMPASDPERRALQPLAAILADALVHAAERGCTRFNWGGTWETQTGVYRFKQKWAGEDHPYRYYTQLNDADVRRWDRERFLTRFPGFYVLPFSELDQEA
jgi:hypothetical protein